MERCIAHALDAAGIQYFTEYEDRALLDFYLPEPDLYIEVKSGPTERLARQMSQASNVIAVQGMRSVGFIVQLLRAQKK